MSKPLWVVALSGGVDSTVAALLMQRQGCDLIGITLQLKKCEIEGEIVKSCCNIEDARQARNAADKLGIKHYFLDYQECFQNEVLQPAWEAYRSALTPNPCVWCNARLKFGKLLDYALDLGALGIITGHYARIEKASNGECVLRKGKDQNKDQTYFLHALSQNQIQHIQMPLGEFTKAEVREMAREFGFQNAEKKESQDACFGIRGEPFPETLRRRFGGSIQLGQFWEKQRGNLGPHEGIHRYTLGQRKGLKVALGEPAYIRYIDIQSGNIELTTNENELTSSTILVKNMNWLSNSEPSIYPFSCNVQIRYRSNLTPCEVNREGNFWIVRFLTPQKAVTPGQSAVFYQEDILLGGGKIMQIIK